MSSDAVPGSMSVTPLNPALGAEIVGLDLSRPADDATAAALRDALQRHHFLCIRDQRLSEEQHIDISLRFGPLEIFPEEDRTKSKSTFYNVANVSPEGRQLSPSDYRMIAQKANALWHTDSSYRYIPSYCSLLYAVEALPDEAADGETEFANMFLAYDALPETLKRRIEPLHMVHDYEFERRILPELPPSSPAVKAFVPPVSHPLVRVHRDRGDRRSLYMTTNVGREISGMSLAEGQALHQVLVEHVSTPAFCYRHRWRTGDLMIWDNRCLLHRAREYDVVRYRRVARRTTIAGAGPVHGPFSNP